MADAEVERLARAAAADAALGLELVRAFFANQIDAGAVLREEIARHVRACAQTVGERTPELGPRAEIEAERLIATLPAGWAEGDEEWQEPA